jgi:uncharacterized protein YdaU (DUF1376 family)
MNYYEHHLGDYLRDTAHLSMIEDGAYRRLLDVYYVKEQPIPTELRDACRLVRAVSKPERAAVAAMLREFFEPGPDGWRHKRCDVEIARYQDKQRKARASADARWSHTERNANASPNAMRTQCEGNAPRATRAGTGARPSPVPSHQTPVSSPSGDKPLRESARGARLPADWHPGPEGIAFAEEQGLRNGRAATELARFRDYWCAQPGQKGVKADWPATWRNWVRKAVEQQPKATADEPWAGAL